MQNVCKMKASLKLFTSLRATKNGFPVCVEVVDRGKRERVCVAHSFMEDWNEMHQEPHKTHPDYFEIYPDILALKATIKKVNLQKMDYEAAVALLFNKTPGGDLRFFEAGMEVVPSGANGKLYVTVLNSFNAFVSGVLVADVKPKLVKRYMESMLGELDSKGKKKRSANGVHTYLRTLTAIYSKVTDAPNPFKGIRPKKETTPNKALQLGDLKKLVNTCNFASKYDSHNDNNSINNYRYIWLLMFYLGGVDCVDLAKLRYDKHVVDGRVQFNRSKGGTSVWVNNLIPPQAWDLLEKFDCKPYLVPIYKYKRQNDFVSNMNERLNERVGDLELTKPVLTKSARYTFINRAQQLLVDERITIEIVGHKQQKTHSIYTDEFTTDVRDAAHLKIIEI